MDGWLKAVRHIRKDPILMANSLVAAEVETEVPSLDTTEQLVGAIVDVMLANGLDADSEMNSYGIWLEGLIDQLNHVRYSLQEANG